jgi:hypothetical protein
VGAGQPADATAERVADGTDIRRRAGQRGEAVRMSGGHHVLPQGSCTDPCGPSGRVDEDLAHPGGLDQHGAIERGDRRRVVTGSLRSDAQTACPRVVDDGDDVVSGLRKGHGCGVLIDSQVPRGTSGVPAVVARVDEQSTNVVVDRWGDGDGHALFLCGHGSCE